MIIQEINAKSILTNNNIPNVDLVVNPYIRCEHGCLYCYAEFMKRFTNHHEPWGVISRYKDKLTKLSENPLLI